MPSLQSLAADLEDAACISTDEQSEWWATLAALLPLFSYYGSKEFWEAYIKQLREEHARFKEEYRIEVVTKTRTDRHRVLKHTDR